MNVFQMAIRKKAKTVASFCPGYIYNYCKQQQQQKQQQQ